MLDRKTHENGTDCSKEAELANVDCERKIKKH
jgi:hypothetical protein